MEGGRSLAAVEWSGAHPPLAPPAVAGSGRRRRALGGSCSLLTNVSCTLPPPSSDPYSCSNTNKHLPQHQVTPPTPTQHSAPNAALRNRRATATLAQRTRQEEDKGAWTGTDASKTKLESRWACACVGVT